LTTVDPNRPEPILRLLNPVNHADGTASFRIEREDGAYLDITVSLEDIGNMVAFILALARALPVEADTEFQAGSNLMAAPIETDGLGLGVSVQDSQLSAIVARIGNFPLVLSVPNSELAEFGYELAQKALALSANSEKPQ
jgi:hypothetical protein